MSRATRRRRLRRARRQLALGVVFMAMVIPLTLRLAWQGAASAFTDAIAARAIAEPNAKKRS